MNEQLRSLDHVKASAIDMAVKFGPKLLVAITIMAAGYMVARWVGQFAGIHAFARLAQTVGLCLATAFGNGLCKIGKQHRKPQNGRNGAGKGGLARTGVHEAPCPGKPQPGGHDGRKVDGKHHKVAGLNVRGQFDEGITKRPL